MSSKKNETPQEEEPVMMKFTAEDGTVVNFELLDEIEYEGSSYAVLLPEEGSEFDNGMVHIYEIVEELDSDTDTYMGVDDQAVVDAVFAKFMEIHKDEFNFTD